MTVDFGTELNAVVAQTVFSLLYGAIWAGSSVIWEMEKWSLLRQATIHFVVISASTLPIAYCMHWMEHSFVGFLCYFGIFISVYLGIWVSQYFSIKKRIQQLNLKVQEENSVK